MKVFLYASYTSSGGFKYGSFEYKEDGNFELSKLDSKSTLIKIFDLAYIRKVYGNTVECSNREDIASYIFLLKDLKHSYDERDGFGSTVYVNIAFVFTNKEKEVFLKIKAFFDTEKRDSLAKMLTDSIIPDRQDTNFGFLIDSDKFREFFHKADAEKAGDNKECPLTVETNLPISHKADNLKQRFMDWLNSSKDKDVSLDLKSIFDLKDDFSSDVRCYYEFKVKSEESKLQTFEVVEKRTSYPKSSQHTIS